MTAIDVTFDMRSDTPEGLDPDTHSPTLKRYHQLLWQKALPAGEVFTIRPQGRSTYLANEGSAGRLALASDTIMTSHRKRANALYEQVQPDVNAAFHRNGYTIGGFMLFPGAMIDRLPTLNQARGTTRAIEDRFDLTLECIRRFYLWRGEPSPLREVIARYYGLFLLFKTFDNFVAFFHLQDLVDEEGQIRFFRPFDDFTKPALPATVDEYVAYRDAQLDFLARRNARIEAWWAKHGEDQLELFPDLQ